MGGDLTGFYRAWIDQNRCVRGSALTPVPSPKEHGRGGNISLDEKRDLSEGEVAFLGYAGETGVRLAGFRRLRRTDVTDLALR